MKSITTILTKIGVTVLVMLVAFTLVTPAALALSLSKGVSSYTSTEAVTTPTSVTSPKSNTSSSPSTNAATYVDWANGNLGGGAQAGNGGECPILMIGNFSTGQGIYSGGTGTEPCWSSSIPAVQPGETYNLEVKFKNVGNAPATNTNVRITPNPLGASSPITSRTYTATVSANGVSESDTVSVNLASAQTVSIYGAYVHQAPYAGQNNYYTVPAATVSGSGVNVGTVQPGEYGYVVIALTVGNTPVVTPAVSTDSATNVAQTSATLNGDLDSGSNFSSVWFRYGTGSVSCSSGTYASVSGSNLSAPYSFSTGISGLNSGTTYNFIACGQNNGQTYSGNVRTFTTPAQQPTLTVATDSATNITSTSATMPGRIVSGNNYGNAWIRYSTGSVTCSSGTYLSAGNNLNAGQNFSASQGGLTPSTIYNFIACAQNGNTTVSGTVRTFTTSNSTQTGIAVATNQPSSVSASMVTMQGACITGPLQTVWFELNTSGNLSSTTPVAPTVSCGSFTRSITPPATTFSYRACGSNQAQQACGVWVTVTTGTQSGNAAIDTLSVTSINDNDATFRGETINATFSSVWFAYSSSDTTPECQNGGDSIVSVSGSNFPSGTVFSEQESGLNDNTTYYVRACGIENGNLVSGDVVNFTTDDSNNGGNNNDDDLEISTLTPSSVDSDSATFRGEIDNGNNYDDAWFAYSSDDSSPECSGNDDTVDVSGNDFDEGDTFTKTVSNLDSGVRYYVRACAEKDGDEVEGSVKNFTTDSDYSEPVPGPTQTYPSIQTVSASDITNQSAIVTGAYAARECSSLKTFFNLGTSTKDLNVQTELMSHAQNSSGIDRQSIQNLAPGTRYYYQFGGACDGNVYKGSIESFLTPGIKVAGTPAKITTAPATGGSCFQMQISNDVESVTPGQYVTYRLEWNNKCTTTLKDTIISVHLPKEVEFITTSHGTYAGKTENSIIINLREIEIDDEDFAIINGRIKTASRIGDLVAVQADMGGENKIADIGATAFDIDQVVDSRSAFGASAFGSGFLNNPLLWIGALVLIILALFATRSAYFAGERRGRAGGYAPVYAAMQQPIYHPNGTPAYYPPHTPVAYAQPQYYQAPVATPTVPAAEPRTIDPAIDPDPNAYTLYQPKAYNPKA